MKVVAPLISWSNDGCKGEVFGSGWILGKFLSGIDGADGLEDRCSGTSRGRVEDPCCSAGV